MKKIFLLLISILYVAVLYAQEYPLKGRIVSHDTKPVAGAEIHLGGLNRISITDTEGLFDFGNIAEGRYSIHISRSGFKPLTREFQHRQTAKPAVFVLDPLVHQLEEVFVKDNLLEIRAKEESMNVETVKRDFLIRNLGGSLMKSLERLPGIKTIGIGSGQSKPLIRGLGFNRVVVVDKGMKHEGQQWGADHGLEIDQFATREVEILKGAASFIYGSDAIAGVIELKPPLIPLENTISGQVDLTGKSNNGFYGTSVNLNGRTKKWFFDSRFTYQNYGDYQVPADSVYVYDYAVALKNGYLRNTAGRETNLHLTGGYVNDHIRSVFYFSNIDNESGFFANAHGLEPRRVDAGLHDASARDMLMPRQEVNHFKVINRTDFQLGKHRFKIDFGYQHNFRQEFSAYVNHGYMPAIYPEDRQEPSDLEREFNKQVYSANLKDQIALGNHELSFGLNTEFQDNRINGWSFLVPAFRQFSQGVFAYDKLRLDENVWLHGALRYDFGHIEMDRYDDWFPSQLNTGTVQQLAYLTRSSDLSRNFNSLVYAIGMNFNQEHFSLKWNAGKSFRMPIAKELGANGVNYHYFSYEKGNPNLSPEVSYQFDLGLGWKTENWSVNFSPYYNYFPNYIYLNPTAAHDYFYGAGNQVFEYVQSRVMRYGAEIQAKANIFKGLSAEVLAEYLYSKQLSGDKKGYVLPFSPPPSVLFNLSYETDLSTSLKDSFLSIDYRITAKQDNIVPPEKKTAGYSLINIQAGTKLLLSGRLISFNLQAQNLLNTKYLNHTSFYRLIELPEAGRNLILSVNIPFSQK